MTGTSTIFPDAAAAQSDVLCSLWTPEGIAPSLVSEFVLGASATASLLNHAAPFSTVSFEGAGVLTFTVTNGGSGYTSAPAVTIAPPPTAGSTTATATAVLTGGVVTAINIAGYGSGYNFAAPPAVTIAAPPSGGTQATATANLGRPTYTARSMLTANGSGICTGLVPTEPDQTFLLICKTPTSGSGSLFGVNAISGVSNYLGIFYGVNAGKFVFYNGQGGTGTSVAELPSGGTNVFQLFIGWGSQGGQPSICTGAGGAMGATVTGTASGTGRPAVPAFIGGGAYQGASLEVAFAARLPVILTDAQRLAWYQALRGDGTGGNSPLGVVIA